MILMEKKNYILMHELYILEQIMQIIKNYFFPLEMDAMKS